jgi:hypothetical protein
MEANKPGCGKSFGIVLLIIALAYPAYLSFLWLGDAFTFLGYNFFFFMDSLLMVRRAPPVLLWAILGGLIGFIPGTYVAIRKFKLKGILIFIPLMGLIFLLVLLSIINKPLDQGGNFSASHKPYMESSKGQREYCTLLHTINVRQGPSTQYSKLFVLDSGTNVEILEKGHFTHNRQEWFRVKFEGQEGYVNSRYVKILSSPEE